MTAALDPWNTGMTVPWVVENHAAAQRTYDDRTAADVDPIRDRESLGRPAPEEGVAAGVTKLLGRAVVRRVRQAEGVESEPEFVNVSGDGHDGNVPQRDPLFVGRSSDNQMLGAVLSRLRSGLSAALVVSGEAGIGKTWLLQHAIRRAAGVRSVVVAGHESEVGLAFAGLHQLVSPFLGGVRGIPEPQRDALTTVFGLAAGPPPDRFLVGLATMTLLVRAATERPLVCLVDDVQWMDRESVDALGFVARRLDAESLGLIFGLRSGSPPPSGLSGIPEHRLSPLPEDDMRSLLAAVAPVPPVPHVVRRIVAESEGNPLALVEYVAALSPELLTGVAVMPPALPVGERLYAGFVAQVERLPEPTRQMLLVLSAAGPDDAESVTEACRLLGIPPEAAGPAVRQSIVETRPRLAFRHPLIRSAVYANAGSSERRRAHDLIARVADEKGIPDAAAWHRASATSGPDESIAAELERAADRARGRGGYAGEATYLTLAARRSVPATSEHARRLLAAAHAHAMAGDGDQAELLLDGIDTAAHPSDGLRTERLRAVLLRYDFRTAEAPVALMEAARALPPEDVDQARTLLSAALRAALGSRQHTVGTSVGEVSRALLARPRPEGADVTLSDLIYDGLATRAVDGYGPAAVLIKEALLRMAAEPGAATARSLVLLTWLAAEDIWDDDFETMTLTRMVESHRGVGALPSVWLGLAALATTELRHGRFDAAQRMFDEATSIAQAIGGHKEQVWPTLVELRAWQGREAETRRMAATLIDTWGTQRRHGSSANFGRSALTVLELGRRRYSHALIHAKQVADEDPPGHGTRILPDLVDAAVHAGDETTAGRALDELAVRARIAATPLALGVLARAQAVVLGRSTEAEALYQESLLLLRPSGLLTETARTQLGYGEWLRRRKRRADAREPLDAALVAFSGMGAALFAHRAAHELAAAGGEPRPAPHTRPSDLTVQERQVAELAAEGMTNTEISRQLFVSDSTVDYHLSKVFRKLGITSRRRIKETLRG